MTLGKKLLTFKVFFFNLFIIFKLVILNMKRLLNGEERQSFPGHSPNSTRPSDTETYSYM